MLLVRHGESEWNAVHRWQGQADPPLTSRGEAQAVAAAESLVDLGPFEAVITSTLDRAARTGDLIAGALGIDDVRRVEALIERFAGPWQGLTRAEIDERYPGYLTEGRRPEGYEGDQAIVERCGTALRDLAATFASRTILVVSHGGVINALERHRGEEWVRLDNLEARWFTVEPASDGLQPIGERVYLVDPATERTAERTAGRPTERPVEGYA